ncbi:MAG: hypothetical protein ACFNY0_01935, partial [Selenomonas sp.]
TNIGAEEGAGGEVSPADRRNEFGGCADEKFVLYFASSCFILWAGYYDTRVGEGAEKIAGDDSEKIGQDSAEGSCENEEAGNLL